jgi:hypothetical protein
VSSNNDISQCVTCQTVYIMQDSNSTISDVFCSTVCEEDYAEVIGNLDDMDFIE